MIASGCSSIIVCRLNCPANSMTTNDGSSGIALLNASETWPTVNYWLSNYITFRRRRSKTQIYITNTSLEANFWPIWRPIWRPIFSTFDVRFLINIECWNTTKNLFQFLGYHFYGLSSQLRCLTTKNVYDLLFPLQFLKLLCSWNACFRNTRIRKPRPSCLIFENI